MAAETPAKRSWGQAFAVYLERPVLSMLFLGFSAGLPFYLVFSTLSGWLRTAHIERATIGMLGWVGLMYTFKWMWAPIVDRVGLPVLDKLLGRRRGWIALAQSGIATCLFCMSLGDPAQSVTYLAIFAVATAFFAATQDIAVDAWRIESMPADRVGEMASAYQIGYRIALLVGQAGAFAIANDAGWRVSYGIMATLAAAGLITTALVHEPARRAAQSSLLREQHVMDWMAQRAHWPAWLVKSGAWFFGAVAGPVADFFGRYGLGLGLVIFAFICSYRLTDFAMGSMSNPFYIDLGFSLKEIAGVVKLFGLIATIVGVFVGGLVVARLGAIKSLLLGSLLVICSNIGYSIFGTFSCDLPMACAENGLLNWMNSAIEQRNYPTYIGLATIVSIDNIALGVHGTALIAFLSGLTSAKYTATQYAVLSSLYALPGKLLMGTSGFVVDALGYGDFFLYTASLSIPGLLLLIWINRRHREIVDARD
jgi:PAT family beta-lactamase induction signal transducer AmpG